MPAAVAVAQVAAAELPQAVAPSSPAAAAPQAHRRSHDSPEGRPPRHPLARLGGGSPLPVSPSVDGLVHVAKAAEAAEQQHRQSAAPPAAFGKVAHGDTCVWRPSGRTSPLSWFTPELMGHHQVSSTTGMRASKSSLSLLSMRCEAAHDLSWHAG